MMLPVVNAAHHDPDAYPGETNPIKLAASSAGSPRGVHTLATHPDSPGRVYAATGDGLEKKGHEYAESTDGNKTWTYQATGIDHHYGWAIAVDPGDPKTRVLTASPSAGRAHDIENEEIRTHDEPNDPLSVIYRYQGDEPWKQCTEDLPEPTGTFVPVSQR